MSWFKRKRPIVRAATADDWLKIMNDYPEPTPEPFDPPEIPYDAMEPRGYVYLRDGWWRAEVRTKTGRLLWEQKIRGQHYCLNIMMSRCRAAVIREQEDDSCRNSVLPQWDILRRFGY